MSTHNCFERGCFDFGIVNTQEPFSAPVRGSLFMLTCSSFSCNDLRMSHVKSKTSLFWIQIHIEFKGPFALGDNLYADKNRFDLQLFGFVVKCVVQSEWSLTSSSTFFWLGFHHPNSKSTVQAFLHKTVNFIFSLLARYNALIKMFWDVTYSE